MLKIFRLALTARAVRTKSARLNANLARAHSVLGSIEYQSDWDWIKADASLKKAMALDPSAPDTLSLAGSLAIALGSRDVGIDFCKKAVALDPLATFPRSILSFCYFAVDNLTKLKQRCERYSSWRQKPSAVAVFWA